ncbi:phage tail tape measure protein [Aerobium aerolatum]|uniref:Phage tail tape measure protein, TP901 family, core region n=1 Tax=Aquamicrobium aerolatum DSM 21857 TaxID=1121003 RepID=A0A1I3T075_9HYPH|nr:phage tail tape measure protein [Aquamicrobium aerolatum]SFJ63076.1 phage tail tape measure protein, TP901 family, core region [Aquamicrobium aerolatum DSM 21857]
MSTRTSKLIVSLVDGVSRPARGVSAALNRLQNSAQRTSGAMLGSAFTGGAVRNLIAMGAGYVGITKGIGGTVGAAIKFEESFADVRKVVDGTPAQLQEIRHEILSMSRMLPTSAEGIAAIYAAAGQSNIPIRELGKFSEMVAKVAVAWDTTESETSQALAEIKTQLGFGVDQIGLYADALNHLGNNTAARAPDLIDYSKRIAAQGQMYGFAATESLAFGSAMISMGAESNIAATSFRNMGMALADADSSSKKTRASFKRLGLDYTKLSKRFNDNATGTMLDVFERIQALPEHERLSTAISVFGREARALMPIINNTKELKRQLGLVARETDYAGSAFEEYMVRAETSGNALSILWNKFRAFGIGVGDSWLPAIKELGLGVGDVLDTLHKRIGVLDEVKAGFSAFMGGFGYGGDGGLRKLINDMGDTLFGKAFDGHVLDGADERAVGLAKISNTFRNVGRDFRAFADDIRSGDVWGAVGHVGDAISRTSGAATVGGALAIALTGRALLGLASGAAALALSKTGRIFLAAIAVAKLIEAVKGADSIGNFVENMKGVEALEWAAIGAGILMLVGPTAKLGKAIGKLFGRGKPAMPAAPKAAPASPKTAVPGSRPPATPGLATKPAKGFKSPFAPEAGNTAPVRRGPTGTPVRRAPVPAPMMDLPAITPKPTGWGAAAKNLFGKGGLIATGLLAAGEWAIEAGLNKVADQLYTSEQRAKAAERTGGQSPSTLGNLLALDRELGLLFPSLRALAPAAATPGGFAGASGPSPREAESRSMLNLDRQMNDIRDLLDSRKGPQEVTLIDVPTVQTRPTGTQQVRVVNPMPAPVINVTVNASTNADPRQIASATRDAISAELASLMNGSYSDGVA